jgi:hypothetical protein
MAYYITTFCNGPKYSPIKNIWLKRINEKCKNFQVAVFENITVLQKKLFQVGYPGYIWAIRFKHNLDLLLTNNKPIVMCDLDVIIEKDIQPIVDLPFDIIISTEIGGANSYPKECSSKLGFGVCCGFMVIKPTAKKMMFEIFKNMVTKKYNTYDDQVNIMNYIVNSNYKVHDEEIVLDNVKYINKIIEIDNIKICVLDFDIIVRDPIINNGQFGNHINIDNVGGTLNFLKYFDNDLEKLPLTCRCGKKHLGDNNQCKHIELRKSRM